jgi:hypothetical protein
VQALCNTVIWAYTESIELTIPLDIQKMYSTCNEILKNRTQEYFKLEQSDSLKGVTTNELRKNLKAQIDSWLLVPATAGAKPLEGTAGSEHPKFVMFWTNEKLLAQIALSLSESGTLMKELPLSASSTIVLEFTQEEGEEVMVRTFINDQLVDTFGCQL